MEGGLSPSPKPSAMTRRDLSHRFASYNALVLQTTFICVKGGDVSAWFNVACVKPPPSSSISYPLSRKSSHDMKNSFSLWELNPSCSTRPVSRGILNILSGVESRLRLRMSLPTIASSLTSPSAIEGHYGAK
jgi:hypothetical protein